MWIYKNKVITEIPPEAISFTYKITRLNIEDDNTSPIYYIGKKNFYRKSRKKILESDWMEYYGSSEWLKEHVKKYGSDNFEREILEICFSKSEATYKEVKLLIENEVLEVDHTNKMKKLYYNLSILGRYSTNKFFTKSDLEKLSYYKKQPDKYIDRFAVNNGVSTRFLNSELYDIEEFLLENPEWTLGTGITQKYKDMICCTDGIENIYIEKYNIDTFLEENKLFYKGSKFKGKYKRINNGIEERRIPINDVLPEGFVLGGIVNIDYNNKIRLIHYKKYTTITIPDYHKDSYLEDGWEICPDDFNISTFSRWINKDSINKKIKLSEINSYLTDGWELGRYNNYNKNKVSIVKDEEIKYISIDDIESYIKDGWILGGKKIGSLKERNLVLVSDNKNNKKTIPINNLKDFLSKNPEWKEGFTPKHKFNTKNQVFVYDITKDNLPLIVTPEEYKNNKNLVLRNTVQLQKKKGLTKTEINRINKYYLEVYPKRRKIPTYKYHNSTVDKILKDIEEYRYGK